MSGGQKACRYCGKVMPSGSLFRHEHVMCQMKTAPGVGAKVGRLAEKPKPVEVVARPSSVPEPRVQTKERVATNGHCQDCLFRDLDRHIEQDLVRRAVVAGMALDAACAFVREAKVALAK